MSETAGFQLFKPMTYEQYLRSPQWRAARAAALMRAGHRCALDATHCEGLEVLHNTRERLGAELERDLIVLCASCRDIVRRAIPAQSDDDDHVPHAVAVRRVLISEERPRVQEYSQAVLAAAPALVETPLPTDAAHAASPQSEGSHGWPHIRPRRLIRR